jgi:hypothetical protein
MVTRDFAPGRKMHRTKTARTNAVAWFVAIYLSVISGASYVVYAQGKVRPPLQVMPRFRLTLLLLALLSRSLCAQMYDAEADLGIVANNDTAAAENSAILTRALEASWPGGKFHFSTKDPNGTPIGVEGAVLDPIHFSGKQFFFASRSKTAHRTGCINIHGTCGRNLPQPSGAYDGPQGGNVTRFTIMDGDFCDTNLLIRGNGGTIEDIQFNSRPYILDSTGEGPDGPKSVPKPAIHPAKSAITIEGRVGPTTGVLVIRNCSFVGFDWPIRTLGGYFGDDGAFVPYPQNADNGLVEGCVFHGCGTAFRSENPQSVCWTFRDSIVSFWGGAGSAPIHVRDMPFGGKVAIDGLSLQSSPSHTLCARHAQPEHQSVHCAGCMVRPSADSKHLRQAPEVHGRDDGPRN